MAGLVAASEGSALGRQVPLALSVACRPSGAGAEAAVAAAGPAQPLMCALEVEPSTAPAAIVLLHDGRPLPQRELVLCFVTLCPGLFGPIPFGRQYCKGGEPVV